MNGFPALTGKRAARLSATRRANSTLKARRWTSLFVHNFYTAFVPVNSTTYFGRSAGGFYRDTGTVDNERNGLKKVTAKYSSRFAVA